MQILHNKVDVRYLFSQFSFIVNAFSERAFNGDGWKKVNFAINTLNNYFIFIGYVNYTM